MAVSLRGKFSYILLSVLAFCSTVLAALGSDPTIIPPSNASITDLNATEVLNRQQVQLDKLEWLVRNLSLLVSRLESSNSEQTPTPIPIPKAPGVSDGYPYPERVEIGGRGRSYNNNGQSAQSVERIRVVGSLDAGDPPGAVSVTRHNPFWSERFQFVSAVKLHSNATCINILPFKDFDGLSKYTAVGNELGKIYVILRNGEVLIDFNTTSASPVTSMLSYISAGKNETVLITGHKNGLILAHRMFEASTMEEWSSISMNNVGKFDSPPEIADGGQEINMLELHYVGRTKYILSTDISGTIRVFRENGTVYGFTVPSSKPLAFLKQRLLFLTETGAGSIDLRTMKIKENECEGLNYSSPAVSYTFDSTDRSKAYGLTSDGDLIHIILLGDVLNFKCRARVSKKKIETINPIALQAIRGYLLVVNPEKVFVYNISSQQYVRSGGLRLLFTAGIDEVRYSFPHSYEPGESYNETRNLIPLIASDREKMIVLSLGDGYVGTFRSNLPVSKPESNTILWSSPVLFFVLFLFAAWYCFSKKKEALTSWGPDDPFTSTPVNFVDSRNEGGGIRGSSRRYPSPTRFTSGTVGPFRANLGENGSRPGTSGGGNGIDPSLGTRTSELKFRGANVESTGLQKRRESLYGHGPVLENKD